jgi:hypothetical protein
MDTILNLLRDFGLTFVPLFVAMDSISTVPILLSLTHDLADKKRRSVIRSALITALGLGLVFIVVGKGIFIFLGITVNDFLVAGGLILFLLAAKELVVGKMFEAQATASCRAHHTAHPDRPVQYFHGHLLVHSQPADILAAVRAGAQAGEDFGTWRGAGAVQDIRSSAGSHSREYDPQGNSGVRGITIEIDVGALL